MSKKQIKKSSWRITSFSVLVLMGALLFITTGKNSSQAQSGIAKGSLFCCNGSFSPAGNPTKYDVRVGVPVTARIDGATDVGSPAPATVEVFVKSSNFGNHTVIGTLTAGPQAQPSYTFEFTAPPGACDTTVVSYKNIGLNSNNDYRDDGSKNNSKKAASGFRFVTTGGEPIPCGGGSIYGSVLFDEVNCAFATHSYAPLSTWTIKLNGVDINGNLVALTYTTGADGTYRFENLTPGDYTVTQEPPCPRSFDRNSPYWFCHAHLCTPAGGSFTVPLSAGDVVTGLDFLFDA